ncbi:MAG: PaaX family transcriptional regulator C-terminal domain-containing protein [Pseudomonadota bacterium]
MTDDIARESGDERPRRTWSLIVTVMGDLTHERGGSVDGPVLRAILDVLGANAQAVRTALHRLRADGWIETKRDGRISRHRLSPRALAETRAAAARVYGPEAPMPKVWSLITAGTSDGTSARLGAGLYLRAGPLAGDPGLEGTRLRLSGTQQDTLWPADLREDCAALEAQLATTEQAQRRTPEDIAAQRALIVHDWRRIVLRAPALPDILGPPDWRGASTRAAVRARLAALPLPTFSDPGRS